MGLYPGDGILLASDGLSDALADDEIAAILDSGRRDGRSPDALAEHLIDAALDADAQDNVSVVYAAYDPTARPPHVTCTDGYLAQLATTLTLHTKEYSHA